MDQVGDEVDVIVIGAGPAGENAAGRCADGGLSVAIVERELVGGECSYWGCIPSKTLIRPGDVLAAARRVPGAAQAVTGRIDVAAAFARRDYMTSDWHDGGQLPWLESKGIRLIRGSGRLAGERTVEVATPEGATSEGATHERATPEGVTQERAIAQRATPQRSTPGGATRAGPTRLLRARRAVVLATGTRAAIPPIDGLREAKPWDNRGITAAKELPRRLLVLGGGAAGAEMAQCFRRLGCDEVTVVEGAPRLLTREEPFAGEQVRAAFEAEGMTVVTGVAMTAVRRERADAPVIALLANGRQIEADEILVAVGRRPATSELGLDSVGLDPGSHVEVDDRLRAVGVADGWLYAVGDCNGKAPLTHMGKYQARIAADVILGKDARDVASAAMVPRVTFTDPQVCAVGYTEEQARAAGLDVRAVTYAVGDVPGAYTQGEGIDGISKLVVDERRRVIVGATFTGPGLQELLHSATLAVVGEVPLERLWHAVPSFPTVSEVWLHLLEEYGL